MSTATAIKVGTTGSLLPAVNEVAGTIIRVRVHKADSGWSILIVQDKDGREHTVQGICAEPVVGEKVVASGEWVPDKFATKKDVYSKSYIPDPTAIQLKASRIELNNPQSLREIESFLVSMIDGIGPVNAAAVVKQFGVRVFDIIENEPERLLEVSGLGPDRVASIVASWSAKRDMRDAVGYLVGFGVTPGYAMRIFRALGAETRRLVGENPYQLSELVDGIGFRRADEIAIKVGFAKDHPLRVQAVLRHILKEAKDRGYCGLARDRLLNAAHNELNRDCKLVTMSQIMEALGAELEANKVLQYPIAGKDCIFLTYLFQAETKAAESLYTRSLGVPIWGKLDEAEIEKLITQAEADCKLPFQLEGEQRKALRLYLTAKVAVITGGPGTGKTTIMMVACRLMDLVCARLMLMAPTGKAASRIREATNRHASTIHSLIGYGSGNPPEKLTCDMAIADEYTMADVQLHYAVSEALPDHASFIMVGDVNQLPSIGPGKVLRDLIESGVIPVARLSHPHRTGKGSALSRIADLINRGIVPDLNAENDKKEGVSFTELSPEAGEDEIRSELTRILAEIRAKGFNPVVDSQIFTPMNKNGQGTDVLNTIMQDLVNPDGEEFTANFKRWRIGDRVIQTVNDKTKGVANGEVAFLDEYEKIPGRDRIWATFGPERVVAYPMAEMVDLKPAYAITVHKGQGSESPVSIVLCCRGHYAMLQRSLVYTALTRGKKEIYILGHMKAFGKAVNNNETPDRCSVTQQWLRKLAGLVEVVPAVEEPESEANF